MAEKVISMQEWLASLQEAAHEVAGNMLRMDGATPVRDTEGRSPGAYIALVSERNSIHLGIHASPDACRAVVRGLLGLRPDQDVEDADVVDGMSEVMNIVAGKVKSKMSGRDGTLYLGLPMFLPNPATVGKGAETLTAPVKLGQVECNVVVYRIRRAA